MPKLLPRRCAVDARRLVKIIRDTLQSGEQDERGKGSGLPNLRRHNGHQGKMRVSKRREITRHIAAKKDKVDQPVAIIEYETPHLRRDHGGDGPWNKHHGAQKPAAVKDIV